MPLLLALSWGGRDYPWGSFEVLSLLTTATVMGAVFLFAQSRTPHAYPAAIALPAPRGLVGVGGLRC